MTAVVHWDGVHTVPDLVGNQVDVFSYSLAASEAVIRDFWETLSPEERMRADRFVFKEHKARFVNARGALRQFIGNYLSINPCAVAIAASSNGKPYVANRSDLDLRFNLSHSKGLAIFAFALSLDVGVDIEYVEARPNLDDISTRFFSLSEQSELACLPDEERLEGFLRCWTRKEAYLKARGEGLSGGLDAFSVSLGRESTAQLRSCDSSRWTIYALTPEDAYVGALAVEGPQPRIRCRSYSRV